MTAAIADDEPRPYGRFEWERVIRRIIMPPRVKLLALVLASYADPDGSRVRPGVDVLAAVTGASERTVRRQMRTLVDDYGLLRQVVRGGGRHGRGRANVYQLAVPTDLLDRVELLPPDTELRKTPATQVTGQDTDTPATQVTGHSDVSPVDNTETPVTQVAGQSGPSPISDRSHGTTSESMSGQMDSLSGHPGDRLPPTYHQPPIDHPSSYVPTEPPTAREDRSQNDHAASEVEPAPPPPKCVHGLVAHTRPDGTPKCPLCRRVGEADP